MRPHLGDGNCRLVHCHGGGGGTDKIPPSVSGVSTTISTNKAPDELTAENAIYAFLKKQSELESYEITTNGTAVANLMGYTQEIHNITFKNGEDFLNQASSDSALVKMKHQSFSKNGKVVYRNDFNGEMSVATKEEYKKIYGFTADEISLGGYIVNPKTLRYAVLEKTEGDEFTFYMRLTGDLSVANNTATESSSVYVRLQTQAYGSLDNVPAFSDVDMYLTVKKDWTPVSYTSSCSYECKKGVKMSIAQTLTCTYSKVNEVVEIPDVAAFNEKIGSEPSAVRPGASIQDPFTQLAAAFGNTMENGNTLSMPVSISLALSEKPLTLGGDLELKIKEDALESGDLFGALALRLDLDLSSVPLISGFADTLTVRYPGDKQLFLMLNDRSRGTDNILFTYPIDLGKTLSSPSADLSSGDLGQILAEYVEIGASDTGYSISLKSALLNKLNTYIGDFAAKAEATLKDEGGYVRSLLGMEFSDLTVELKGKEKIAELALVLEGEPPANVTQGEKIGVCLDVGLLSREDVNMLSGAFEGELQLRLNPAALLTGDYYAIAEAHLHLDLSPAGAVLQMVGTFAPAGSLPAFVGPDLKNMDVYYTGDGILTLSFNNEDKNPFFVTQVDLKTVRMPALPENWASALFSEFRFERKANGILFALGDPLVQAINAAYQKLVQTATDYVVSSAGDMGALAGGIIGSWLGAKISGAEFFLGKNDGGKTLFDFTIKGIPTFVSEGDPVEISLLTLAMTHADRLTDEEKEAILAGKERVAQLLADVKKAEEYAEKIQKLIDGMDLTEAGREAYAEKVTALKEEAEALPANVQTLISNRSYLADTQYEGKTLPKLLITHTLYCARVDAFKNLLPGNDNYASYDGWEALNSIYDNADKTQESTLGVVVPAVKDSPAMQTAIGEARIGKYIEARDAYERPIVENLKGKIAASLEKYKNATEQADRLELLGEFYGEVKPAYEKLSAEKKAELAEQYNAYAAFTYEKNLEGLKKAYEDVKKSMEDLTAKADATTDELLGIVKTLVSVNTWKGGVDLWQSNGGETKPWLNWLNDVPAEYRAMQQEVLGLYNEIKPTGKTSSELSIALKEKIKSSLTELATELAEYKQGDNFSFTSLSDKAQAAELLEQLHEWRYFLNSVLPTSIRTEFRGDDTLKALMSDIKKYEDALSERLTSMG